MIPRARTWYSLKSDRVVPQLGVRGPVGDTREKACPGIIMPYYMNGDVREHVDAYPSVSITTILVDILDALVEIHSKNNHTWGI